MAACQEYTKDLDNLPFIVGGTLLFLFIAVIVYLKNIDTVRKSAIKTYCEKTGLEYAESVENLPEIADFMVLHQGYEGKNEYKAIMSGKRDDLSFKLVDFSYVKDCGEGDGVFNISLCILTKAGIHFPDMILDEKAPLLAGAMEKSLMIHNNKNIIKQLGDTTFENKFHVLGTNEKEIKSFLKSGVMEAFLKNHTNGNRYDACKDSITIAHLGFFHYGIKQRLEMLKKAVALISEIERIQNSVLN